MKRQEWMKELQVCYPRKVHYKMKLYPVINIKNGCCVRTRNGQYMGTEVYSHFPEKVAKSFENQGAQYLHVVDLDGALLGHSVNDDVIAEIAASVSIPVQVGDGIRSIKDIENKLRLGADRVVIGTKAVENPAFIKEAVSIFGTDKIVVSIDVKHGSVVMQGWEKVSTYNPVSFARKIKNMGVSTIIYTDILKEEMLQGPNVEFAKEIIEATGIKLIVSGGIASLKDLELISYGAVHGALLGTVLYENKFDLKSAIEMFNR